MFSRLTPAFSRRAIPTRDATSAVQPSSSSSRNEMGVNSKRKVSSDDEQGDSVSESEVKPKQKAGRTPAETPKASLKTVKKPKYDVPSSSKKASSSGNDEESDVQVFMNAEGERYVDLGKKKRATVRSFKGRVFVDIREFFGPDDDEKPGKKGISLTPEQWGALKQSVNTIDSFFADHSKK